MNARIFDWLVCDLQSIEEPFLEGNSVIIRDRREFVDLTVRVF